MSDITIRGMSKRRSMVVIFVLLLTAFGVTNDMILTPITSTLYRDVYATAPEFLLNFAITGSAIVAIPFLIFSGWLCDRVDKKKILIFGFTILLIGNGCAGLIVNIYYFTALRVLEAIGWGFVNSTIFAIFSQLYSDNEDEHGKVVGWLNCSVSILGAGMSMAAGIVAVNNWSNVFLLDLFGVVILILYVFVLPPLRPEKSAEALAAEKEADAEKKAAAKRNVPRGWWKSLIPLCFQILFVATCFFEFQYMISLYTADANIGDAAFNGMLSAILMITSMVGSLCFGTVVKRMKTAVYLPTVFIIGAAFAIMSVVVSVPVTVVCTALVGLLYPFFYCYFYSHYAELVPAEKTGVASGIVGTCESIAIVASSYVLTGLEGAMGTNTLGVWGVFAVVLFAVGIVSLIGLLVARGKRSKATE